jgi:hypothetical protein
MPATGQNIEIWQGDSHTIKAAILSRSGVPVAIPGASAAYRISPPPSSNSRQAFVTKLTGGSGGIDMSFENSTKTYYATIVLAPEDTAMVPPGNWYHELEITDNVGRKATVFTGIYTSHPAL